MLLFSAFLASAAPLPLPPHVQAGPLEGFVAVWVDPKEVIASLQPTQPGPEPEPPVQPVRTGGLAALVLEQGVALTEIVKAIEGDPDLVSVKLNDDRTGILVNHPNFEALLARPLADATVGDVVSIDPVPTAILRMPGPQAGSVDLPVENIASARAVVSIGGVEIGEVGPYARAVIHGVAPGTYSLEFRMPNGYVRKAKAVTAPGLSYAAPYRMR